MIKSNLAYVILSFSILILSCSREEPQDSTISMNPAELTLDYQTTFQLEASFNRDGYNPSDFIWETSNEDIVSIGQNGMITGERVGTATITVLTNDRQFSGTSQVTVTPTIFLYQEPLLNFRENKAFIRSNENRPLLNEGDEFLLFRGENNYIFGVGYEFNNTLYFRSLAILNIQSEEEFETLFNFLEQRYELLGFDEEFLIFENDTVVIGLTEDEDLGIIVIYVENDQAASANTKSAKIKNLLNQEKLIPFKKETNREFNLDFKKQIERLR